MGLKNETPMVRIHFHVPASEKAELDAIFGDSHLRSRAFRQVFSQWLGSLRQQLLERQSQEAEV